MTRMVEIDNLVKNDVDAPHKRGHLTGVRKTGRYLDRQIEFFTQQTATSGMNSQEAQ